VNARLRGLRLTRLDNAQVEGLPGQGALLNPTSVALPDTPQGVAFVVRRLNAGQGATVQFVVVDSCGEWPTFVGGGPAAF
jgi:hypothetical protein